MEIPRTIPNRTDQINRRQAKGPRGGRPADFNADLDKKRHTVKRGSVRLKQWRGIASRYDKHAFISLATIVRNHHIRT